MLRPRLRDPSDDLADVAVGVGAGAGAGESAAVAALADGECEAAAASNLALALLEVRVADNTMRPWPLASATTVQSFASALLLAVVDAARSGLPTDCLGSDDPEACGFVQLYMSSFRAIFLRSEYILASLTTSKADVSSS